MATSAQMTEVLLRLNRIVDILEVNEALVAEPVQGKSELLEPCPFCGNSPVYVVDPIDGIYITCHRCRVRTPGYFDNRVTQSPNAIALARQTWNTRSVKNDS